MNPNDKTPTHPTYFGEAHAAGKIPIGGALHVGHARFSLVQQALQQVVEQRLPCAIDYTGFTVGSNWLLSG